MIEQNATGVHEELLKQKSVRTGGVHVTKAVGHAKNVRQNCMVIACYKK
jgi:hypothetical protein